MTDLHCHILPGIDDGAKDVKTSLRLLDQELKDGVDRIVFTPHYDPEKTTVEAFLDNRRKAWDKLSEAMAQYPDRYGRLETRLGAEVFFSPKLVSMDCRPLCIEGSNIMLIELSTTHKPFMLRQILSQIMKQGIVLILAHVERYGFIMEDPTKLYELIQEGLYAQINATTIYRESRFRKMAVNLVRWHLVQVLASDAHSIEHRPVKLKKGIQAIEEQLDAETARWAEINAECLFNGRMLEGLKIHRPKKFLGSWR